MKRICSAAFCVLLAVFLTGTAAAARTVNYELNIPSQVAVNKSVPVDIMLSCGESCGLGAMLFALEYDPAVLTYRETKLSGGAPGELRSYAENGVIKIVYLNTAGTALETSPRSLISIRFTAPNGECRTSLVLSGSQAASAQEQQLACEDAVRYDISILKKPNATASNAKGTRLKAASSGSNSSALKRRTPSGSSGAPQDGGYIDPWSISGENGGQSGVLSAEGGKAGMDLFENDGFFLFLCGLGAAAVLAGLLYGAYRLGIKKKKSAGKTEESPSRAEPQNAEGEQDKPTGDKR